MMTTCSLSHILILTHSPIKIQNLDKIKNRLRGASSIAALSAALLGEECNITSNQIKLLSMFEQANNDGHL